MVTNLGRKLLRVQICFLVSLFPLLASLTCAQVRKELLGLSQHLAVNQQTLSFCTESKYTISPPRPSYVSPLACAQVRKELLGLSQRVCTKPSLRSVCRWGIVSSRKSTGGSKSASKIAAYLRVAKTRKRV